MESLEKIYDKYSRTVYIFLLSKTRDEDLAEELTQETFFQAVRGIGKFKGNSSIVTWLCGIARNLWLNYLRDNRKLETSDYYEDTLSVDSAETDVVIQWESLQILKLLHNLKEPVKEVMYLRLIGNLSFKQIGEIMGKSENWARVNFYRGKTKIIEETEEG